MTAAATGVLLVVGVSLLAGLGGFAWISVREGERRAARLAAGAAVALGGGCLLTLLLPPAGRLAVAGSLVALTAAVLAAGLVRWGGTPAPGGRPEARIDERDIMFARGRLRAGSSEYESYYAMRPEHRAGDDRTRALPGILSPRARLADPVVFAEATAGFELTEALREAVDGEVVERRVERPAAEWTAEVKRLVRHWGAVSVGVAALRPAHVYTHIGRGSGRWGAPVTLDHRWAVAFTVEMDHATMANAPGPPALVESARQYVASARIGILLAATVRRWGYPARAHIDGNYRVVAPLVAREAGLGEIGRIGILMTPRLGPRVRLGVVTTDLPLVADRATDDRAVLDFCRTCKKCATCCPVGAIPRGERTRVEGGLHWHVDGELCYRYWCLVGTDCGVCMRVCPYSHPDNLAHNLVRRLIRGLPGLRRPMLWLDDLFYGSGRLRSAPSPGDGQSSSSR